MQNRARGHGSHVARLARGFLSILINSIHTDPFLQPAPIRSFNPDRFSQLKAEC
jgi:hypothetical protein